MNTLKHRIGLAVLLGLLIGMIQVGVSSAAVRDGAIWTVGCNGFISNGGGFILDRDNTGTGREQFVIVGMDGAGNTIFGPVTEDFFVGGSVYINEGITFEWAEVPAANPLVVMVVSPAGNGFVEQLVYTAEGRCGGLPNGEVDLETAFTSAAVANPEVIERPQPGYLIVNTFRLNIRSGDGPEYTIVGQANGGSELAVLGRNEERTWFYVQAGDIRGWVNGAEEYVITRGDLRRTPVVVQQGQILPPRFYNYSDALIYAEATTRSAALCEIPGDQEYVIVGRDARADWYGIEATCSGAPVVGWIQAEVGAVRNLGDLPIPVIP
ncbi:MAG: SH3 domain-containing protein [Chloroflexota bacterium]